MLLTLHEEQLVSAHALFMQCPWVRLFTAIRSNGMGCWVVIPREPSLNNRPLSYLARGAQARSLLTAHEQFVTLQFHAPAEIQRPGYVFSSLKRHLPDALVEEAKRMSLTADGRCAVFDVPAANVKARAPACWCPLHSDCFSV